MLPVRVELYIVSLLVVTACVLNLNVASLTLLAMVKDDYSSTGENDSAMTCGRQTNTTTIQNNYGGTLEWSANVQYLFLTAPYMSYIISQVFGGCATHKFGTKLVVNYCLLSISLCNLVISFVSKLHYSIAIVLQLIQGFGQGMLFPALYRIVPYWIPIKERSRFMSCFQGSSIGPMIAQIMSGLVISYVRWEYVFIISGLVGLTVNLLWWTLIYNEPELHPRISASELQYITVNRDDMNIHEFPIPWISMIRSIPLWAITISTFGRMWFSAIMSLYGPLYLKAVIGLDAKMNGIFSGAVYLGNYLITLIFSCISDKLLIYKVMSLLANRKLITAIGQIPPALLMISIAYVAHCNVAIVLIIWALIQMLLSVCLAGAMVNIVDIAPIFSGPAMGLVQIVGMMPHILATLVTKSYLEKQATVESWNKIFDISAGISIGSYIFYFIFASSEAQKWNYIDNTEDVSNKTEETELLNRQ